MGRLPLLLVVLAWMALAVYWVLTADLEPWSWKRIAHRWTFREFERGLLLTAAALAFTAVALARRRLEAALRVGLVAAAVGGTLALLELPAALGLFDWSRVVGLPDAVRFTRIKPWDNPSNVADPELVYRRRPGHTFRGETAGDLVFLFGIGTDHRYAVEVRYDGNGFRNATTPERADAVVVGDSFVEAGLVPLEETLPVQLGARLGLSVANLGQSGYGPLQERIVLERYGLPLQPDLVLWLFFEGNDLLDDARFLRFLEMRRSPPGSSFRDRSLLAKLLPRLALATSGARAEDSEKARVRRGRCGDQDAYFAYIGQPLPEPEAEALPGAQATILDARRLAESHGARFVTVFVPTKYRVYAEHCAFEPDAAPARWSLNDLPERMAAWACREDLPFLDLSPTLREGAAQGELVYFLDDGHWNGRGQARAADAIAAYLERGARPCEAAPEEAGGPELRSAAARRRASPPP